MKPSLQKIQKFLKLEADRGYDNRAVMGGLDRMLVPWEAEARIDQLPEELIKVVVDRLRDYANLSPKSRAEALEGLWRRIQRETNITLPPLVTPANEKTPSRAQEYPIQPEPAEKRGETLSGEKMENGTPAEDILATGTPKIADVNTKDDEPGSLSTGKIPQHEPPVQETKPVKAPVYTTPKRPPEGPPAALNAPTTVLPGVGPKHAQTLTRLGLYTLGDMLYYFPRRYDDYSSLRPINRLFYSEEVTVIGTIQSAASRVIRSGRFQIVEAVVNDGTGSLRITWFNQPWIAKRMQGGMQIVLSGKIDQYLGRLVMNNPEWEPLEQQNLHTNRIVPVYPLTANITQRWLRKLLFQVVNYWAPRVQDPLPESIRRSGSLPDLSTALLQTHFPDSKEQLQAARQRLAFDEIFMLQLGVLRQKRAWQNRAARVFETPDDWLENQVAHLPFRLTNAQQCALSDVRADLRSGRPMNRLLQGDVGSGKTVIAALAVAIVTRQGAQAAFMAPTSILAEQHYRTLKNLLSQNQDTQDNGGAASLVLKPEQVRLMIGATPEAEKEEIRQSLAGGEIKLVIGTHALLEDPVKFADLQLVIVDEQHRFGVEQRAILRSKGDNPHLLVMTATPIPRSLALTVYGDLDLSVMDEMPPGRQAIETHILYPRERERAYSIILGQLEKGNQAFIIYPLVEENEENEESEGRAAVEESQRLQKEIFPNYRVGLLHGRMKSEDKEEIMGRFRDREVQVLVSTSVVEVGVDIPNATIMLIEGANRFGLAQLHQFRGRVGRGAEKSYCLLIPETPDNVENERLAAMVETNNGFVLAERDLEQRGPGEFLGTRQAGYSELKMASLSDVHLIEKARQLSQTIFERDPELGLPEHRVLAAALARFWGGNGQVSKGDIS